MQNKIFNSTFELSLRALLLLSVAGTSTVDRLTALDFITIYGRYFEVSKSNLHGDNDFSFGELTVRREKMPDAVKALAFDGLIDVQNSNSGFVYRINLSGQKTVRKLRTGYAAEYIETAKAAIRKYGNKSEVEMLTIISAKSAAALEWR